jgi:two-component system OmpR family sensor kinase
MTNDPTGNFPSTEALRTVSLRRRVTLVVIAVLGVVLLVLVIVVNGVFAVTSTSSLDAVLADRAQFAQQLARQGAAPETLIRRVDGREVRAGLVLSDGQRFGSRFDNARETANGGKVRNVRLSGSGQLNNAVLTLAADAPVLTTAKRTLLRVLLLTTLGALLVTGAAMVGAVRFALAPLDAMTTLARSITRGRRGRRLSPTRTDTELGRTAQAFDDMLDALEGAERQARTAEQASKASEENMRRFVADAAHELRTPIAGVHAIAETVLRQSPDADPEERQRLQLLLIRESRRAGKLVDDLLDLARLDAGVQLELGNVDLRALIDTQADRARLQHPELHIEVEGDSLEIFADGDRVSQILANVVDNACQASSAGGTVTIILGRSGTFAEVLISDDGPGVASEYRERIFGRLVRLDDARERRAGGSGLGLPIARGFARAHGGELRCEQPPPGATGAAFRLRLPLADNHDHDTTPLPTEES